MKKLFLTLTVVLYLGSIGLFPVDKGYPQDEDGGVIIFSKPVKGVYFSHKEHKDFSCKDCHEDIFAEEAGAAEASGNFTMKLMEEGETGGTCHDGETAFSVKESCTKCHVGVLGINRLREKLD
jgi:c(7)-type cytochrome triheme protein